MNAVIRRGKIGPLNRTCDLRQVISPRGYHRSAGCWLPVKRVVGVAVRVSAVERRSIIGVKRKPEFDALWQIGIRDKMTTESNQVGISFLNNRLCALRFETTRGDNLVLEDLAHPSGRNGRQTVFNQHAAFNARLDG